MTKDNPSPEFITINELAERWRCKNTSIYRIKDKISGFPKPINPFQKRNGMLFRLSDIIEYENKCKKI